MRTDRLGSILALAAVWWLGIGAGFDGRLPTVATAAAQGSLTPPAGQPRATAPGGMRGRSSRRSRRLRLLHSHAR